MQEALKYGADITARDEQGKNALHRVACSGNAELVGFLLQQGAPVNVLSCVFFLVSQDRCSCLEPRSSKKNSSSA